MGRPRGWGSALVRKAPVRLRRGRRLVRMTAALNMGALALVRFSCLTDERGSADAERWHERESHWYILC